MSEAVHSCFWPECTLHVLVLSYTKISDLDNSTPEVTHHCSLFLLPPHEVSQLIVVHCRKCHIISYFSTVYKEFRN